MTDIFYHWISNQSTHPFYARKTLHIGSAVEHATIRICGLGQFNLYINGLKVGNRVLDPAWTDYRKVINYITFDIAEYLTVGKNVIAAEVGNGWYIMDSEGGYSFHFPSFMPPNPNPYQPFGDQLILTAHIEIKENSKDTPSEYDTDSSWKVAESPVQVSNVYGSEIVDGRNKIKGWNTVDCDDSAWKNAHIVENDKLPKGILAEQLIPGIEVIHTYPAVKIGEIHGRDIYDFGQNTSGMLAFEAKGKCGDTIRLFPAEKLGENGDVDQIAKNWLDINVCETYILGTDNEWETFEMSFTYVGARYVAVEYEGGELRNLCLHAITSATVDDGEFYCDDERYLKIYDMVKKSVEANLLSVHTYCPTIERFAWQEENHLMAPSIMYMKNVKQHWEKYLQDTRLAQHKKGDHFKDMVGNDFPVGDGLIPSQAPCYLPNVLPVPGMGDFYDIVPWGSSIILGTYHHYQFYGDIRIIEDNYESGKRYLNYLKTKVNDDGFLNHGLGDWGNPKGEYAKENIETAFLYADAIVLAEFAELLASHHPEQRNYRTDAEILRAYAEEVRLNYNNKLLVLNKETGQYCYKVWGTEELRMTQAAEALPLYWDMVPKEVIPDIVSSLKDTMLSSGSFCCGEVGQPYIIQTLSKYGMNNLIAAYIVKEEHPSYYAFILDGETTLGEYWEKNPRSHNHDMMGHIAEWFYNGLAGIKPLEPGFKRVLIKPYLPDSMNNLHAVYHSISGDIDVRLKRNNEHVQVDVHVQDGIRVEIDKTYL